ncbi:hypothetical protein OIU78_006922 [Salix suchowensis]|nr:hypothetical protein OIU78_006922 [Salix suchowensis]
MDFAEKIQRCREHLEALEEERRKIQVFERELPLCLELVTQAIEAGKRELSGTTTEDNMHGESDFSEQTSSGGPLLEEFIPIKRTHSYDGNDDYQEQQSQNNIVESIPRSTTKTGFAKKGSGDRSEKKRGLDVHSSPSTERRVRGRPAIRQLPRHQLQCPLPKQAQRAAVATGGLDGGSNKKEDQDGGNQRKQRRCWSTELHRTFLHALQQLGGSHAATPKQIRELMKVDGLTNDEVKSHLQKYRLHTRRPSPTIHNNSNQQAPQIVVVGGIWVPPPEYAAVAATAASTETSPFSAANGINAPIAAAATTFPQKPHHVQSETLQSEGRDGHCEGGAHSGDSPCYIFLNTYHNNIPGVLITIASEWLKIFVTKHNRKAIYEMDTILNFLVQLVFLVF